MMRLVQKLIKMIMKGVNQYGAHVNIIKLPIVPKVIKMKNKTILSEEFLKSINNSYTHLIAHHSTGFDNPETKDWDNIDIYHRSFRMNWNIMVRPETAYLKLKKKIELQGNIIKVGNSYYPKDQVLEFYKRASVLMGEELYLGQYVSTYIKNTKIETPWNAIGYTLGIERAGGKLVVRYGRKLNIRQAHCYQEGMNSHGIGLLIVGNYDKAAPDGELWRFAIKVVREIKNARKGLIVLGHREVKGVKKTCPGELFNMKQFREDLKIRRK